jgi:hypothetical protein
LLGGERGTCGKDRDGSRKDPQSQVDSRHFDLPDEVECVVFLDWERLSGSAVIEYRLGIGSKKKPPASGAPRASFSRSRGQQPVNEVA